MVQKYLSIYYTVQKSAAPFAGGAAAGVRPGAQAGAAGTPRPRVHVHGRQTDCCGAPPKLSVHLLYMVQKTIRPSIIHGNYLSIYYTWYQNYLSIYYAWNGSERLAPLDLGFTYTDGTPIAVVHTSSPLNLTPLS